MTVDEQIVMERLEDENDETTRTKIVTERRSAQVTVYNDFLGVLEENDGEEKRRNRRIETFDEFVTLLNRRIERSEEGANINEETTLLRRRIEGLERQNVESQTKITGARRESSESHTTIDGLREEIRNLNDRPEDMRRPIGELEEERRRAQKMITQI